MSDDFRGYVKKSSTTGSFWYSNIIFEFLSTIFISSTMSVLSVMQLLPLCTDNRIPFIYSWRQWPTLWGRYMVPQRSFLQDHYGLIWSHQHFHIVLCADVTLRTATAFMCCSFLLISITTRQARSHLKLLSVTRNTLPV